MKQQDMHEQGGTRPAGTKGALNDGLPIGSLPTRCKRKRERMDLQNEGLYIEADFLWIIQ